MWPNYKCVINIVYPQAGLNGAEVMAFSICSMSKLAMMGERGEPIAAPSVCSKNWFSNWKYVERRHSLVSCMTCHRDGGSLFQGLVIIQLFFQYLRGIIY